MKKLLYFCISPSVSTVMTNAEENITVPEVAKEYSLGEDVYIERSDYGNLTRLEETDYYLLSI